MEQVYPAGIRVHGYLADPGTSPVAFSWFDDNGNAYTLQKGDRLVVDELAVTQGSVKSNLTVFFDNSNNQTYSANTGQELYNGDPTIGETVIYPHGSPRAGNRLPTAVVNLYAFSAGSTSLTTFMCNARIIKT